MGKTHAVGGALAVAAVAPVASHFLGLGITPAELAPGVVIGSIAGVLPDIDHPASLISNGYLVGQDFLGRHSMLGHVMRLLGWYLSVPPRIVGHFARSVLNHRGGTHSALFMVGWTLLCVPIYAVFTLVLAFIAAQVLVPVHALVSFVPTFDISTFAHWLWGAIPSILPLVMCSVALGYTAHLIQDSCTKVPVPWPWPFIKDGQGKREDGQRKRIGARWFLLPKGLRMTTDSPFENHVVRPLLFLALIFFCVINIALPLASPAESRAQTALGLAPPVAHAVAHVRPAESHRAKPASRHRTCGLRGRAWCRELEVAAHFKGKPLRPARA